MRQINNLTEKDIARIWQYQLLERGELFTEDGEPLQVIYPGWLNDEEGADFRQAVIVIGKVLSRGDIEIHLRSSGWQEHGHQRNAAYNRVILHVVMWHNVKTAIRLQNGGVVPVFALGKYVTLPADRRYASASSDGSSMPCCHGAQGAKADTLVTLLDEAGDERFLLKVARFQRDLTHLGASQCLYQGIMGALGYSRNKLPFLELARRLPLRFLESVTEYNISDGEWLSQQQTLLLGGSGLLTIQGQGGCPGHQLSNEWTEGLFKFRASLSLPEAMSPDAWHLMRVRPNNSPIFRLVAMSYLLLRYREEGLLEGMAGLVREAPLDRGCHKGLEAGLVVAVDNYPPSNSDSGQDGRTSKLTLLGRGRAADIIVNVLLPFVFAWSQSASQPELGSKALELYRLYPRLTVNSVERYMTGQLGLDRSLVNSTRCQQGLDSRLVNSCRKGLDTRLVDSACRQQGLLHIYKNLCSQGKCGECPLTHP